MMSPDDYTIVPATTALKNIAVSIPEPPNVIEAIKGNLIGAKAQEKCSCHEVIGKGTGGGQIAISWSAYHASPSDDVQPALTYV